MKPTGYGGFSPLFSRKVMSRNYPLLGYEETLRAMPAVAQAQVSLVARGEKASKQTDLGFMQAFYQAQGRKERLANMLTGRNDTETWLKRRHDFVHRHMQQVRSRKEKLWKKGKPTDRHLALIAWAYSPSPARFKSWLQSQPSFSSGEWKKAMVIPSGARTNPDFFAYLDKVNPEELCVIAMHVLTEDGAGERIGYVYAFDGDFGLTIKADLSGIPTDRDGFHGFHIHTNPDLSNFGKSAGGHLDPENTDRHSNPFDPDGHLGDMPALWVVDGASDAVVRAPLLSLDDILGRSVIIHSGGDNYSDHPLPNGGGKSRIVGGIVDDVCPYCPRSNPDDKRDTQDLVRDKQGRKIPKRYLKGYQGEARTKRIDEITKRRIEYQKALEKYGDETEFPKKVLKKLYRPFRTDKGVKTTKSKYSEVAKQRGITGNLKSKVKKASELYGGKIPMRIAREVYRKGMGAWASGGHRGGASSHAWAAARLDSFLTGGKTYWTADRYLAKQLPLNVQKAIEKDPTFKPSFVRQNPIETVEEMGIEPIAAADQPHYDWYKPMDHDKWYYFLPRQERVEPDFERVLQTVDPLLHDIVEHVGKSGYQTAPSCQGHIRTDEELEDIYEQILADVALVRHGGLLLENVETGQQVFWKNDEAIVPITSTHLQGSGKGYIGMLIPKIQAQILINKLVDFDEIDVYDQGHADDLQFIEIETSGADNWATVTDFVKAVIR